MDFSVPYPAGEVTLGEGESYFGAWRKTKDGVVEMAWDARPFAAIVSPMLDAGFRLEEGAEPEPTDGFREKRPDRYETT